MLTQSAWRQLTTSLLYMTSHAANQTKRPARRISDERRCIKDDSNTTTSPVH